jgi:hypothetical protein
MLIMPDIRDLVSPGPTGIDRARTISLEGISPVAAGRRRSVYPVGGAGRTLVLKVPDYGAEVAERKPLRRIRYALQPNRRFRVLSLEADYSKRLHEAHGPGLPYLPLPRFLGYLRTSRGVGAVWEGICGADGRLGETLASISRAGRTAAVLEALNGAAMSLFRHSVVATDLQPGNLVLSGSAEEGRFFLVDGFGDPNAVPLRTMFKTANEMDLNARLARLSERLSLTWDAEGRAFRLRT